MPTVVLIGTLDTKGIEYAFIRKQIKKQGVNVILVDAGVLGAPQIKPDIPREAVAQAAGADVQALAGAGDRGAAVMTMARGAAEMIRRARRLSGKDCNHTRPGPRSVAKNNPSPPKIADLIPPTYSMS